MKGVNRLKQKLGLLGIILVLLVYGGTALLAPNDGTQTPNSNAGYTSDKSMNEVYSFRTEDLLASHYQKHGTEFGDITTEEYLQGANELINSSSPDILTKYEAEDGDKIYYAQTTNEFLVLSADGYIRTYFKPDDGIAYYNRQ